MLVIVLLAVVGVLAIVLGVVAASRRGDPPAVSTTDPAPLSVRASGTGRRHRGTRWRCHRHARRRT
ncbi:hypothetical protein [Xanthomonas campestris]|uniref:hypothetical protein n=1 Tax=Xanthomonas campestris TaxID=339 RepID=UPI00388D303A